MPSARARNGLLVLLIFLIFLALLTAVYQFTKAEPGPEIVVNVIELRSEQQTLVRSQLISRTEDLVQETGSRAVQSEWGALSDCIGGTCEDTNYFNFIQTVVHETSIPHSALLTNIIATYKYWGTDQVVLFSRAMTEVNEGIGQLYSRTAQETWKKIVACDGQCGEENELYFSLIKSIVESG